MPGLAVAHEMRRRAWQVVWMGHPAGMEASLVPRHGIAMRPVRFGGLRGKGIATRLALPWNLLRGCLQALAALRAERPAVVLGLGGYVSFPGGLMARLSGRPLVLHEQNSVAGLANRVLARIASRVLVAFPQALPGADWTGNPVREDIAAIARIDAGRRPQVVHQSGRGQREALVARYREAGVDADVREFIDDMAAEFAAADLVVCRAGAMTVAELAVAGVPAILVPYPHAVDDHQSANARFLVERGAGWLLPQSQATPQALAALIEGADRAVLLAMAQRAREAARPDATRAVADACEAAAGDRA
jgi:UDP-N-acetylglucosamine--N-acetylmuramyl-(pentapeptide) pyrophosphoryl-undecaprenol N-acetylglucosamine transferase